MNGDRFDSEQDVASLVEGFSQLHKRVFGFEQTDDVEFVNWKARRTAKLGQPPVTQRRSQAHGSNASAVDHRSAYFGSEEYEVVPVFQGSVLDGRSRIVGPAIIQEPTTTLVVYPGYVVEVTEGANYVGRPISTDEVTDQ